MTDDVYNSFVEDYNNPNITTHDVRRINHLNSREYVNIRNMAITRGDIPKVRHMNSNNAKFYCKSSDGNYTIQKQYAGVYKHICKVSTEEDAKYIVRLLLKTNWVITDEIQAEINRLKVKPKNYSVVNGYYIVQKSINGKNTIFCSIRTDLVDEETIKLVVERFREVDWDKSFISTILAEFNIY